jgi:hypothetical protein
MFVSHPNAREDWVTFCTLVNNAMVVVFTMEAAPAVVCGKSLWWQR